MSTTCTKCGEVNPGDAKYCGGCGAILGGSGSAPPIGARPLQSTGGSSMGGALKVVGLFVAILIGGGVLAGGCGYKGYRNTVALDENVKSSWGDVEVVLKRRFDLIPNLVETVKGYAKHEKELLQGIADARKAYTGAATVGEKAQAASQLDGFLSRLLVIQERYPELKANENFRSLQVTLERSEERRVGKGSR